MSKTISRLVAGIQRTEVVRDTLQCSERRRRRRLLFAQNQIRSLPAGFREALLYS
jgi:hypothetical protein